MAELSREMNTIRKSYVRMDLLAKVSALSGALGLDLKHISGLTYDSELLRGNIENPIGVIQIPLGIAGPLAIHGEHAKGDFYVPFATTEGALLLTYDLGMRFARMCGEIMTRVISNVVHG